MSAVKNLFFNKKKVFRTALKLLHRQGAAEQKARSPVVESSLLEEEAACRSERAGGGWWSDEFL